MQTKKLEDIVDITVGHTMQKSLDRHIGTDLYLLRTSDIPDDLEFTEMRDAQAISIDAPQQNAFVNIGDILITARSTQGAGINCSVVKVQADKPLLATSSLFIMRVIDKSVSPEYIALYLNSTDGQRQLKKNATQGTIQAISIKQLRELEIPMPDYKTQEVLVALGSNVLEQKKLMHQKLKKQDEIVKNIISSIIK